MEKHCNWCGRNYWSATCTCMTYKYQEPVKFQLRRVCNWVKGRGRS